MMTGRTQSRSDVAQVPRTKYAWVALAALIIVALVLGPLGSLPGSVVFAQEGDREEPFPEVAGPVLARVVLASESDREEPFPEVAGLILASVPLRVDPGLRYTDVSAYYVERLRAQAKPQTDISAFYVERLRSQIARDAALATDSLLGAVGIRIDSRSLAAMGRDYDSVDPLLGAVGIELGKARLVAGGEECPVC